MREFLDEACENIDASMFSGDCFMEETAMKELEHYMARWTRQITINREMNAEEATVEPDEEKTNPNDAVSAKSLNEYFTFIRDNEL